MGTRPPLPDSTTDAFVTEALNKANAHRAAHHAPPLTVDAELTTYAKSRAASRSEFESLSAGHDGLREGTGENIYWGASSGPTPSPGSAAVDNWYSEIQYYDFAHPESDELKAGHFTQLIWKGSTKVGIARVSGQASGRYETYIVFVFEAPGNYSGEYAENVVAA